MSANNDQLEFVEVTALERDEQVDELNKRLEPALTEERGFRELDSGKQNKARSILRSLKAMRFESRESLESTACALIEGISSSLSKYVSISLENAAKDVTRNRGILVIYTGGTIGSAPKDPNDPDSPQVVRPWSELKNASPQLGLLGYPVDAISFVEPLDSCNVGPRHWRTMAKIISENYEKYEGFVILHGTDSLVYTSSALSFMLMGLNKPVIITGSQVAGIVNARNDAHQNMITSIMLANPGVHGLPPVNEVLVVFGNRILRGCRAKKTNVIGFQGFDSPNYPMIGEAGEIVTLHRKHMRRWDGTDLQVFQKLDTDVILLEVFPGMQNSPIVQNILRDENLAGVVLKAYGAGNIPTNADFLKLFTKFINGGGVVVVVTSVSEGEVVMGLYETSQVLIDRGLIGGFDLTPEAAMCKLMMLLGEYPDKLERPKVRQLMQQSLVGEQRLSLYTTSFDRDLECADGGSVILPRQALVSVEDAERIEKVILRFRNTQFSTGGEDRVALTISLDDGTKLGVFRRGNIPEHALVKDDDESVGESLVIDLTEARDMFLARTGSGPIKSARQIGFQISLEGNGSASFSCEGVELNVYAAEA